MISNVIRISGDADFQAAIDGFTVMRPHTDRGVVEFCRGKEDVYALRKAMPWLKFTPGLWVNDYLKGKIDDLDGWERMGRYARELAVAAGVPNGPVWLDASAENSTLTGEHYSWQKIRRGAGQLGLSAIWSPGAFGTAREARVRVTIASHVAAGLNRQLMLLSAVWSDRECQNSAQAGRWDTIERESGLTRIALLLTTPRGHGLHYWRPDEIPALLAEPGMPSEVWLDPGSVYFAKQCRATAAALTQAKTTAATLPEETQ
jgi:hypothetical protein